MTASSLAARLIKATGKNSRASILTQSKFFDKVALCSTSVPLVNALFSGHTGGGLTPGSTMIVGDSRTFKTNMCLFAIAEFMRTFPDAVMIFVDSEFGAAAAYFRTFGIDTDRVVHIPVEDIEQMTFEVVQILEGIEKGEHVAILIDSVSQVSSKKEAADALEGKGTTDMTRARTLNSFWRIVTPKLNLKSIPLLAINSYYDDMTNKYAERHIKGGKQGFLSADAVWYVSRSKEKDDENQLEGFTFTYNIMKSRFVKEGSKFPIRVTFEGGIDKYSGVWDLARESGLIDMPSNAWYTVQPALGLPYPATDKFRRADLDNPEFLDQVVASKAFKDYVEKKYRLSDDNGQVNMQVEKVDGETGEITLS